MGLGLVSVTWPPATIQRVLSEAFLRSLNRLRLDAPRRMRGVYTGERPSKKRGRSVEFADYRAYTPGDDPRRLDWNILARHGKTFIKLFEDEEDATVTILLDASGSMRWLAEGEAESSKWRRAAEVALAIGCVALSSGDRVIFETSSRARCGPRRGLGGMSELIRLAEREAANPPDTRANLNEWLRRHAAAARPGLCYLVSDMLDPAGYLDGLNALGGAGLDVSVLHTLCPDELEPGIAGDLRLRDIESAEMQDVSLDPAVLSRYRERLTAFTAGIRNQVMRRGGRYQLVDTSTAIEQIVLGDLRRQGWLA